ncbi:MAG TPA: hypothetical protein VFO11_05495 [Candidatus Polarisedimenticolaceae bacterium]|nr:hypothetical protein [Candidatus Polarisedimenticolaceae bacterium]
MRGIVGTIELRTQAAPELRWSCASSRGSGQLALEVGSVEGALLLRVPEGDTTPRRAVVSIPSRIHVRVEGENTQLVGDNVQSEVSVRGFAVDVRLSTQAGSLDIEVQDGNVFLDRPKAQIVVRGKPQTTRVLQASGQVSVLVAAGTAEVSDATAGVDVDTQGAKVVLARLQRPVRVHARDGTVQAEGLSAGGDFDLERTPLTLKEVGGEVTVTSDSLVEFRASTAALHIHGLNAPVKGTEHHGLVEIETDSAEVLLSKIDGPLRIRGNSLTLRLEQTTDTGLITSSSSIQVNRVDGLLAIENELGSVEVQGATGKVEVKNRDGNVTLLGLSGPAVVETSSERLVVSWASLPRQDDVENVLINEDGVVIAEVPPSGSILLDAESRYGRVESSLPWVRVADDGKSAKGMVGRGEVPRLRIVGEGGVVLGGPGSAAGPPDDRGDPGGGEP